MSSTCIIENRAKRRRRREEENKCRDMIQIRNETKEKEKGVK